MSTLLKVLFLGSLPLLLFACRDNPSKPASNINNSSDNCGQYEDSQACEESFLPNQVRETPPRA